MIKGWYALRYGILLRDKFTCQHCGQFAPNVQLEADHIIPYCDGGTDDPSNLTTLCYACNRGKEGLRTMGRRPLVKQPTRTRPGSTLVVRISRILETKPSTAIEIAEAIQAKASVVRVILNRHHSNFAKDGDRWFLIKQA